MEEGDWRRKGDMTVMKRWGWRKRRALMTVWSFPTKWNGGWPVDITLGAGVCGLGGVDAREGGGVEI